MIASRIQIHVDDFDMTKVSHRKTARKPVKRAASTVTVRDLIKRGARQLDKSGVFFGHGTDNAIDDAAALVWHALRLPEKVTPRTYDRKVTAAGQAKVAELFK